MNIIEVAVLLAIEPQKIGLYTKEELAEMEARLQAEKERHPNLTDELIKQFLKALSLKKHVAAFQSVMNNRALFNFFARKNYAQKQFQEIPENKDQVKAFITTFLIAELNPFVVDRMLANNFNEIGPLAEAHEFLPNNITEWLYFYTNEKLDLAASALKPPFGDFSKILYIKDANFYLLLNGLKNEALEEKVKLFFTPLMNMYMGDKTSELAKNAFTGMKNYKALDEQLSKNVSMLKESAEINFKPFRVNRKKYYWIYAVVGLFVFVRVSMFISDLSNMNSQYDGYETYDDYETESEPRKLDRYYTDMRFKIDSFQVFLADYNHDQIRRLTKISDIRTGENPFQTFYENQPTAESSNYLKVRNNSEYDIVLLENAVLYDSIKIPRTAHFIKAGESVEVNFNNEDAKTIFNVYMGKKLATFQTESNHLFVRNGSVVEYRFSELIPNVKEVMSKDYILINDADIDFRNGTLRVDSEGATVE